MFSDLVPCLRGGGSEVIVDRERFEAGKALTGQMDQAQDEAEVTLLVLTPDYLHSQYCRHELERAVARDPKFAHGSTVPVIREPTDFPDLMSAWNPLCVDMTGSPGASWDLLMRACGAELGCSAPQWLAARDELVTLLSRGQSVNLVVRRREGGAIQPRWRRLVEHIAQKQLPGLALVDLERGAATSRPGLIAAIFDACGDRQAVPAKPEDLVTLDRALSRRSQPAYIGLLHFDYALGRADEYEADLFGAFRELVQRKKLVLLVQSRRAFVELLPRDHPLSSLTELHTVEL